MSDQPFAEYLPHIRRRWQEEQEGWVKRRTRAWEAARRAADVLRHAVEAGQENDLGGGKARAHS